MMSDLKDRATSPDYQTSEAAADEVIHHLASILKPKARAKAVRQLEAHASRLETWQGCRVPHGVTVLRGFRAGRFEQALADEAQRRERAAVAAEIRKLIGRAF